MLYTVFFGSYLLHMLILYCGTPGRSQTLQ